MVLWLHGGDGAGTDNLQQIIGDRVPGSHLWTLPENQKKYAAFVVAPQSPIRAVEGWTSFDATTLTRSMQLALEIVQALQSEFNIDPRRLYVVGQSVGGLGTWDLITKKPDLFAAAVIFCGRGFFDRAAAVTRMPIW
jgi:predicted peptidase